LRARTKTHTDVQTAKETHRQTDGIKRITTLHSRAHRRLVVNGHNRETGQCNRISPWNDQRPGSDRRTATAL